MRDDLADRLAECARRPPPRPSARREARLLIERMLLDPGAHRWVRVANEDIGEPGCKHWHVRPRLGLIGMLAGWWHVKISSGCPLPPDSPDTPDGPAQPRPPRGAAAARGAERAAPRARAR